MMRLAKIEDEAELREIWKLAFGDEDSFIELHFKNTDWVGRTAVLLEDGRNVSMLTMIPVELIEKDGTKSKASMIYAVATHPDFQKRGYAEKLLEFSNRYLMSVQTEITLLVPAREELFRFYEKRGYLPGFPVREAVLGIGEIEKLAGPDPYHFSFTPVLSDGYNRIRKCLLRGRSYVDYRDAEIDFQKKLALIADAGIFGINGGSKGEGCAYYERISQKEVLIKELLVTDGYEAAALKQFAELVPAEKYIVRTPAYAGAVLGGSIRPFGMIRFNEGAEAIAPSGSAADSSNPTVPADRREYYLGIAYD